MPLVKKKIVLRCGNEHGYLGSRMDAIILNMFEINYSRLIQYEILEKLVTFISAPPSPNKTVTKLDKCGVFGSEAIRLTYSDCS